MGVHTVDLQCLLVLHTEHDHLHHQVAIGRDHIDDLLALAACVGLAAENIRLGKAGANQTHIALAAELLTQSLGKALQCSLGSAVHGSTGQAHQRGRRVNVNNARIRALQQHGQKCLNGIHAAVEINVDGTLNFFIAVPVKALKLRQNTGIIYQHIHLHAFLYQLVIEVLPILLNRHIKQLVRELLGISGAKLLNEFEHLGF